MAPFPCLDIDAIAARLAREPALAAAWVFGSVARGDASEDSDLDLAILLRSPSPSSMDDALRSVAHDLERFSPSGQVDMVVLGRQGPVFRHRVLREGILVLDADPPVRHEFEGRTISEYLDWKPTHEIAMRSVFEGLRRRFEGDAA